jgi:hypothetical protein
MTQRASWGTVDGAGGGISSRATVAFRRFAQRTVLLFVLTRKLPICQLIHDWMLV